MMHKIKLNNDFVLIQRVLSSYSPLMYYLQPLQLEKRHSHYVRKRVENFKERKAIVIGLETAGVKAMLTNQAFSQFNF